MMRSSFSIPRAAWITCAAFMFFGAVARADVVVLKDGRSVEGTVISDKDGVLKIQTEFGPLEFPRADVVSIEKGKTRAQDFADREAAAKTAEDFYQLGAWAQKRKMTKDAKRCMQKALDLDPKHAGAHAFFGHVEYKGEWLTPEQRDLRQKSDEEAAMLARGLVRFQDRWVTPDEKLHLEKNEVQVDGRWIPFADAQRKKGLEEYDGQWLPRAEALARVDAAAAEKLLHADYKTLLTAQAIIVGPQGEDVLKQVGDGLQRGREWFDTRFKSKPGLELFGGRLAEFYLFKDNDPYVDSVDYFASLTKTVPPGWADAVKKTHGYLWWDPYPLSSARQWSRTEEDLVGHCFHHWGHLLLNRLGYDGRLLPPWYDEGVAALLEYRSHQRNAVFCKGSKSEVPVGPSTGGFPPKKGDTKVGKGATAPLNIAPFDPRAMRDGNWKAALLAGVKEVPAFDKLASLQFNELESADIAASMGIVEWLESRGPDALRNFHDVLRKNAPPAPARVLSTTGERERMYEAAFQAATGIGWKAADQAWRQWITTK